MENTLALAAPFSLDYTLESGQVFRWDRRGEWWYGVVSGGPLKVRQEGDVLRWSSASPVVDSAYLGEYFRLSDDMALILASIAKDETMTRAVQKFYGLHLVRQERWECLASFLLATNANIPRIKKMVESICLKYGVASQFEGATYHMFPKPEAISSAKVADLRGCGLGYRAPFLKHVATSVLEGKVDFTELASLGYETSRSLLLTELLGEKTLLGVGPKVADCVLLYSCGKDEAFPIDVWIGRALSATYPHLLGPSLKKKFSSEGKARLTRRDYETASLAARNYFGRFAGYAQQYLYMAVRSAAT